MCNGRKQKKCLNMKAFFVFFMISTNCKTLILWRNIMTYRLSITAAYFFSFLILVGAGSLPTSNSGGSSSNSGGSSSGSYSNSGNSSTNNPLNALELKNGLNMIQSLVYGKKYKKAENKLISLEVKFPQNADIQNYLGFVSRKMNKLGKSDAYYKKALQLNPMHKGALEYQGELFLQYKNLEKANANLSLLERICGVNCDEYKELKKAIENFK